ncbi:MAG TPA: NAD(P)/FAD-dependent oxidoreductase [Burkholderiales bacterium]|nr:NAD(P)/FAD-dependent oxidoreductase [Burkholderiales bacterium]
MSSHAIVIGDDIDECVAAQYLARNGLSVRLLHDRQAQQPRFLQTGWIAPQIVRDLELSAHGLSIDQRDPWLQIELPGGGRLELTRDIARSAEEIGKVNRHDGARWAAFCERMHALATLLQAMYAAPPPEPLASTFAGRFDLARLALRVRGLGRQGMTDLFRVLPMSIVDLLDEWFESDALKGALGTMGVMHLCQGPRSGGTALNFLHHHAGCPPGVFRQPLSNVHGVLRALPGPSMLEGRALRVIVEGGTVEGVQLATGEEIHASVVLSGAHPQHALLDVVDAAWLDPELVRAVRRIRSRGVTAEVTLALDRDPGFTTLTIAPSLDYMEHAYDDAKYGRMSREPFIEARYAGTAEGGEHPVHVHVQYAPYAVQDGTWDAERAQALGRTVLDAIAAAAPGIVSSLVDHTVRTPQALEREFGYPEGQPYHAELALDQFLWMRPVPDLARYRTPIRGYYLCGPAMHPGAGVPGAAGMHAAHTVLRDLRTRK